MKSLRGRRVQSGWVALAGLAWCAPAQAADAVAPNVLGIELNAGMAIQTLCHKDLDVPCDLSSRLVAQPALVWQWRVTDLFYLGPRLAASARVGLSQRQFSVDLGAHGVLRWPNGRDVTPRFVFGIGPSWNSAPADIPSFNIEHERHSAFSFYTLVGLGIERLSLNGRRRWFAEFRGEWRGSYEHEHILRNINTGQSIVERESVGALTALGVFGWEWGVSPPWRKTVD